LFALVNTIGGTNPNYAFLFNDLTFNKVSFTHGQDVLGLLKHHIGLFFTSITSELITYFFVAHSKFWLAFMLSIHSMYKVQHYFYILAMQNILPPVSRVTAHANVLIDTILVHALIPSYSEFQMTTS
jgi:hypothetical protein